MLTAGIVLSAVQEIYPPRLHEFSYVTDNTCKEEEILKQEVVSLKVCICICRLVLVLYRLKGPV